MFPEKNAKFNRFRKGLEAEDGATKFFRLVPLIGEKGKKPPGVKRAALSISYRLSRLA